MPYCTVPTRQRGRSDRIRTFLPGCVHSHGCFKQESAMETTGKVGSRTKYLHNIKESPYWIFITCRGKKIVTSWWRKPAGTPSTEGSQLTPPGRGKGRYQVPPDETPWGHNSTSETFLPKIHGPDSNHEETSDKPKLRDILQISGPCCQENVKVSQGKERPRKCFRLKSKRGRNPKCRLHSSLDPGSENIVGFFCSCFCLFCKGHLRKLVKSARAWD